MGKPSEILSLAKPLAKDYLVAVPFAVAVAGYVAGLSLSPEIDNDVEHARWTGFFGTAAQVTATLLVVLAVEGRLASRTEMFARLGGAVLTVGYVAVGIVAAVAGLSPSLSGAQYRHLFAITVAGGAGALFSVVLIGARALRSEYADRDAEIKKRVDERIEALKADPS
jgi:hypothetical protein